MTPLRAVAALLAATQVFFGLPWLPSPAQAQTPPPRLWLGPLEAENVPGAGLLSRKFDEASRAQFAQSKRVEPTDRQGQGPVAAGEADPRVEQAERLRVAGQEAFTKGENEAALEQLQAALELYEEGIASVQEIDAVALTLGYLGAASSALGYDAAAKDWFKRLVALQPDAEPLDVYSAEAKAQFLKVRKKLLKKKRGQLRISTTPAGATIKIDGREVGASPVTVKKLVRGFHYVQAADESAGLAGERVKAKGGKTKSVALALSTEVGPEPAQQADATLVAKLLGLSRDNDLRHEFKETAAAIASQTRADCVVVGYIRPQGNAFVLTPFLYGVEARQVAALDQFRFRAELNAVNVEATRFAAAAEAACVEFPFAKVVEGVAKPPVAVVAPPIRPQPEPAKPEPPPKPVVQPEPEPVVVTPMPAEPRPWERPPLEEDDDDPWYGAWWVWTLAGAAVIGGAAYGGYVLLDEEPESGTFDGKVTW